jgi:hypothetical protein
MTFILFSGKKNNNKVLINQQCFQKEALEPPQTGTKNTAREKNFFLIEALWFPFVCFIVVGLAYCHWSSSLNLIWRQTFLAEAHRKSTVLIKVSQLPTASRTPGGHHTAGTAFWTTHFVDTKHFFTFSENQFFFFFFLICPKVNHIDIAGYFIHELS